MRPHITTALFGSALAGAVLLASPAAAEPYFYRNISGSWTNVEYNDGLCHYYFAHNAYDGETKVNRYGDCSQIAIAPNGAPMQLYAAPAPY